MKDNREFLQFRLSDAVNANVTGRKTKLIGSFDPIAWLQRLSWLKDRYCKNSLISFFITVKL